MQLFHLKMFKYHTLRSTFQGGRHQGFFFVVCSFLSFLLLCVFVLLLLLLLLQAEINGLFCPDRLHSRSVCPPLAPPSPHAPEQQFYYLWVDRRLECRPKVTWLTVVMSHSHAESGWKCQNLVVTKRDVRSESWKLKHQPTTAELQCDTQRQLGCWRDENDERVHHPLECGWPIKASTIRQVTSVETSIDGAVYQWKGEKNRVLLLYYGTPKWLKSPELHLWVAPPTVKTIKWTLR